MVTMHEEKKVPWKNRAAQREKHLILRRILAIKDGDLFVSLF